MKKNNKQENTQNSLGYTFISGATGGIGKAFAIACAKKGYSLFLTARNQEKLELLKQELINSYDIDVCFFPCDLTSLANRRDLVDYIDKQKIAFNRIINVAGVDTQKGFLDYTEDKLLFQLRVNSEATIWLTHQLLNRRAEKLEIITISSMSAASPMPYFALYSATKCTLINLFTALHYELADYGVKVSVIMPGAVPTRPDIIEDIKGQGTWGKLSMMSADKIAEKSLKVARKNKVKYIPGFFNKFLYFIIKLMPKCIVLRFIKNRWKKQTKDAFDGKINDN